MCVFPEQVRQTDGGLQLRSRFSFLYNTGNVPFHLLFCLEDPRLFCFSFICMVFYFDLRFYLHMTFCLLRKSCEMCVLQLAEGDPCEETGEPHEGRDLVLHTLWQEDEAVSRNNQGETSSLQYDGSLRKLVKHLNCGTMC